MLTAKRYVKIWLRLAAMSFAEVWATRVNSLGWFLGKVIRLVFFLIFIMAIFKHTQTIQGYTLPQAILFFLTFNLVDLCAQLFFRGIYGIKRIVTEGELDYYLLQPINPLFRISSQTVDFLDLLTAIPVVVATFYLIAHFPQAIAAPLHIALYALLVINGVAIAFAIHVIVAAIAIATQQLENTIWVYRDLMILGRFPIDIYSKGVRAVLTFAIPIAVMTSFPAKALLGTLTWQWMGFAFVLAGLFLTGSLKLWNFSLSRYSSVSS